jgi:hypothetical protein
MSGEDVKASSRCSERNPKKHKTQEGIEQTTRRGILHVRATDRQSEQNPEGEVLRYQRQEGTCRRRDDATDCRGKPLKRKLARGSGAK